MSAAPGNIAEAFLRTAQALGKKTAIIEQRTGRRLSFAELERRAAVLAGRLRTHGIEPGCVVILMVKPSCDFICLTLALFQIGATIVLIDPGMGYKNLLRCISRVKPQVLIGIPKAVIFARLFPSAFSTVQKYLCCGSSFGLLGENLVRDEKDATDTKAIAPYQPAQDDLAAIIFTTGSTGPPKGVCYEHSIFNKQLSLIRDYYEIGSDDIDLPAFPLFALFATALGACAVIPDMDPTKPALVNPATFVRAIQENKVTYSFGSPAIWNVVSRYCVENGIRLPSLKKVLMAGAPVPYELLQRMIKILPDDAKVFTPYGATESLPIVSIEAQEILAETWEKSRAGEGTCVGRPLPGIEIRIIPISDRVVASIHETAFLPVGSIGEIIVRGEVVTKAYANNDEETCLAKIYDADTIWHRMGDVGYLDEEGRLWFCGRRAHRVVTEHETLYTIPCESVTNAHPQVFRSALVGAVKEKKIVPVMIVEPHKDKKYREQDLLNEVRELAKQHPLTRSIEHFLIHPGFPVDIRHNAKIFREKLAIWARERI